MPHQRQRPPSPGSSVRPGPPVRGQGQPVIRRATTLRTRQKMPSFNSQASSTSSSSSSPHSYPHPPPRTSFSSNTTTKPKLSKSSSLSSISISAKASAAKSAATAAAKSPFLSSSPQQSRPLHTKAPNFFSSLSSPSSSSSSSRSPVRQSPILSATTTSFPSHRSPFRLADTTQNARPLNPQSIRPRITATPPISTMPERRQPQLAKALNRTPLTPKVATSKPSQAIVSPLARRSQPDVSTPVAHALLSTNVTSRSGTRQSRVDSANTTPSSTPTVERSVEGWDNKGDVGVSSLNLDDRKSGPRRESLDRKEDKFFYVSDTKKGTAQPQRPLSVPQKPATFFYANGSSADSKQQRTTSPPSFTPTLASTPEPVASKFFYANGAPDYPSQRPALTASASTSNLPSTTRMSQTRQGASNAQGPAQTSGLARPSSPIKNSPASVSTPSLQSSAMPPVSAMRSSQPGGLAPAANPSRRRVSIEVPPKPKGGKGHARTGSVPNLDPSVAPKVTRPLPLLETSTPPLSPRPVITMASMFQAVQDLVPEDDESGKSDSEASETGSKPPDSPGKSANPNKGPGDVVANARRERKVQDLEITNASLEAINRTLERQLRKQTAELRRYRRLSRSGRFPISSTAASSRVTSAAMTESTMDFSDMSEEDTRIAREPGGGEEEVTQDDEQEEEDYSLSDEFSSDESKSGSTPPSPNAKMAARRKREEIRLQLDLTKHQELLIDSQKINQSIKRCLEWTDMLIKDGVKALEYKVKVSDVSGQVLLPLKEDEHQGDDDDTAREDDYADDDYDYDAETVTTDLEQQSPRGEEEEEEELDEQLADDEDKESSSVLEMVTRPVVVVEGGGDRPTDSSSWEKAAQDRDSGIELPSDGG